MYALLQRLMKSFSQIQDVVLFFDVFRKWLVKNVMFTEVFDVCFLSYLSAVPLCRRVFVAIPSLQEPPPDWSQDMTVMATPVAGITQRSKECPSADGT